MQILSVVLIWSIAIISASDAPAEPQLKALERSYWLHASLALKPHKGYWGPDLPLSETPSETEVAKAAKLLAGPYAANRLYLVYHREISLDDARQVFLWWRRHTLPDVEIVPTLVLRMYDKQLTPVFTRDELQMLCEFYTRELKTDRAAVFDVYPDRDQGSGLAILAEAFAGRLIRVGIQPDEQLKPPMTGAVQDTWSGFCHGKTNEDWLDAGFGAETLRKWIEIRNRSSHKTAWDLIVVAWDYGPTQRGEYPGYDDANKNMPLPASRNLLAAREILRLAQPERLAGFSSDLTILQANSIKEPHDGPKASFYQTLKQGEVYRGYYGRPFTEISAIYRAIKEGRLIDFPLATQPSRSPLVRIVDLDVGESLDATLHDGSKARLKLLEVTEQRDEVARAVRESPVRVEVNGEPVQLACATYHLPVTAAGIQLDCPCTRAYTQGDPENGWGLTKAARLRLWPAKSPLFGPGTFRYPVGQRWFAGDTQMSNEPVFVDGGDLPAPRRPYYHSGLDFGGVEGMVDVFAAADGLVVCAGLEVLPGHEDSPVEPRYDAVFLLDDLGWYYHYSHLQSIDPAVKAGLRVSAGTKIGVLGKEGGSGGWSHLHFDIYSRQPSGLWGSQDAYAYVWEACRREYDPRLIAVARPHRLAWVGQSVTLDGTRSWIASGEIARYDWTLTGGTKAIGARTERTYSRPGTYSEILKVTAPDGKVAYDFAVVQVIDKADPKQLPPTIHAAYAPTMGIRAGDPVTFKVRSFRATAAGREVWDFGDGSPVVEVKSDGNAKPLAEDGYATTIHVFKKPGDYIVRVERTGEKTGQAVAHLCVTVSP